MSVIDVEDLIRVAVDISPLFIIAAGIICFVFAMIRKSWVWLTLSSVFNIAAGISGEIGKRYFDNLPAYGFMAGFTYLGDYLLQLGYEIAGFVLFVVFLVAGSIVLRIQKKKEKELLTAIQNRRQF
ncbi:MAG: hypothetical protein K6G19_07410 [Lachnospiraceae bacterium]|nr:hypothetical protein [Lachnospiraceae bacterium]